MEIKITARHCTIPDGARTHAHRLLRRLDRLQARATTATLDFEQDTFQKLVDARLHVAGHPPIVARGTGPTFRSALDNACDRLERQLKRRRQRRLQRRTELPPRRLPSTT
ncbi:MAG: ribosome hibernation-promoting factor, HPF/YfiA family [Longimicrobiales bacterium]